MSAAKFKKWERWLDRILEDQLRDAIINRKIFRTLCECTKRHVGTKQGSKLSRWMTQTYVAYASTTVRRMTEEPTYPPKAKTCPKCKYTFPAAKQRRNQSISLLVLLRDVQQNANLLTYSRFRKLYKNPLIPESVPRRAFYSITRNRRAMILSAQRIDRDIRDLKRATNSVRRLVNKVMAHTEQDRRKKGIVRWRDLHNALDLFIETYKRYDLLVRARNLDLSVYETNTNVEKDLKKMWP